MDTWSPCWRLDPGSDAAQALDALATVPTARGRRLPELVGDHRVVWFESARLLAAEGHPAGAGALASPSTLPDALQALTGALEGHLEAALPGPGAFDHSPGFLGVRRLDPTVNLGCESTAVGVAVLAGIASLDPGARLQRRVIFQPGGRAVETVTWRTSRGVVARVYDKGVESGSAARGRLVRLEAQHRYPAGTRRLLEELTTAQVRDSFRKRFVPLWRATKGLKIVTSSHLAKELKRAVEEGRCTPGEAVDIAGHLVLEAAGVRVGHRATRYRHRTKARELGLVMVDGVLQEVEVDLHAALEEALEFDAWEADADARGATTSLDDEDHAESEGRRRRGRTLSEGRKRAAG